MKKSKCSDTQIMAILKQVENGVPISDLCREHGMSGASFYKWRSKYGGMDASLMARMTASRLRVYADFSPSADPQGTPCPLNEWRLRDEQVL